VVLADTEEVDADQVGENALLDDIANRLGMRLRAPVLAIGPIAERVEPKDEGELGTAASILGPPHSP
jgi:hypothetical protein